MKVMLISRPSIDGALLAGRAASVSTRTKNPFNSLEHSLKSGHESVLEHASYTFLIEGVSRVLLAQLTRHRIASFTVESQRYVDSGANPYYVPDSIRNDPALLKNYDEIVKMISTWYQKLKKAGVPSEDARYILPGCITTTIMMTMNARELRHFFELRCCNRAQKEIRELADAILAICRVTDPSLFRDCGPGCVHGHCPELKPCGHPREDLKCVQG